MFDLAKIDQGFDEAYEAIKLSHTSRELAIWRLLTCTEDFTRLMYIYCPNDYLPAIFMRLDDIKYVYKFSVQKVYKSFKSYPSATLKLSVDKNSYPQYSGLVLKSVDYSKAVHLMAMLFSKTYNIASQEDNNYYINYRDDYNLNYNMLESVGLNKPKTDSFIQLLLLFYCEGYFENSDAYTTPITSLLIDSISIKNRKVIYNFDKKIFRDLISLTGRYKRNTLEIESFNYSWGDSKLTLELIDALIYRCLYHLLCIHIANDKYQFIGGFENSLVLVIKKSQLIKDISSISNISDLDKIKIFLEFLEFPTDSEKGKKADAALQPLFLHQESYFIPCFHIIESNIERNLMTLFARNESELFNRQSKKFEEKMVSKIEEKLSGRLYKKNYKKRINKKDQEFDFLLIDEKNKKVVIIELRWMIQPADPREVIRRVEACMEKVEKIKQKKKFFSEHIAEFSRDLEIPLLHEYSVDGIVVIDGYSGCFTEDLTIPLVPMEIFNIALEKIKNFNTLYEVLCTLDWLPQKNIHFKLSSYTLDNKEGILHVPAIELLDGYASNYLKSIDSFFLKYE